MTSVCEVRSLSRSAKAWILAPLMSPTNRTLLGPKVSTPAELSGPEAAESATGGASPTADATAYRNTSRLERPADTDCSRIQFLHAGMSHPLLSERESGCRSDPSRDRTCVSQKSLAPT